MFWHRLRWRDLRAGVTFAAGSGVKIDFYFMKSMRYTDFGMKDWGSLPEEWRGIPIERQQSLLSLIPFNYGFSLVVFKVLRVTAQSDARKLATRKERRVAIRKSCLKMVSCNAVNLSHE